VILSKRLLLVSSVLSVLSGSMAAAQAEDTEGGLRGKFRFTANGACTESTGGFSPRPWLQPLGSVVVLHESYSGTMVFDGRGGATESVRGMTMFDGPFFPNNSAVGTFVSTCAFTYSMIDDLSFVLQGSCNGTLPDGAAAGQSFSLTGVRLVGQISRDGDMIVLSGGEPAEQEITLSGGYTAKRYCIENATLLRGLARP
jgi:hypothetical protein